MIYLSNRDRLEFYKKAMVLNFAGRRKVLSTSVFHGGYREDLSCIFNFDEKTEDGYCEMTESTYEEHLENVASKILHLDPESCTGLSTAVTMEHYAMAEQKHDLAEGVPLVVTAIVTGGIDKNGARVGDPACWQEVDGQCSLLTPGTINILLHFNVDLAEGTMARALVTATEAKTAAVEELFCPSRYSEGIATGSGTDGVILVCDAESPYRLTAAGKDCKLGEMIGRAVQDAVKEAIEKHTGVNAQSQHHVLRRLERFGIKEEMSQCPADRYTEPYWVAKASLIAHLLDQQAWGMLSWEDISAMLPVLFPEQEEISVSDKKSLLKLFFEEFVTEKD